MRRIILTGVGGRTGRFPEETDGHAMVAARPYGRRKGVVYWEPACISIEATAGLEHAMAIARVLSPGVPVTFEVDGVSPEADLSRYRIAGGALLVTFHSGLTDENERVHLGGLPACCAACVGCGWKSSTCCLPGN